MRRMRIAGGAERIVGRRGLAGLGLFLAAGLVAASSFAETGRIEINHTCAVQTGCFPGDTAGYPVSIDGSAGRSYLLTSDLIVPDENTDGIVISTTDISLDLNHFTIVRSGCEGVAVDCTPASGTGSGIERTSSADRGTSVRNGSITGMGNYGVLLGHQAEVRNLRVRWTRVDGISTGNGSIVSGNLSYQNGNDGIWTSTGSTIRENTVYQNGHIGIMAGTGSMISENSAYLNGDNGIFALHGATVKTNTAYENGLNGIQVQSGAVVSGNSSFNNGAHGIITFGSGNTVEENSTFQNTVDGIIVGSGSIVVGNAACGNGGNGIFASGGSSVRGNTVRANTGFGLVLAAGAAYRENVINDNLGGTISGASAVDMSSNSCNGTTTCP